MSFEIPSSEMVTDLERKIIKTLDGKPRPDMPVTITVADGDRLEMKAFVNRIGVAIGIYEDPVSVRDMDEYWDAMDHDAACVILHRGDTVSKRDQSAFCEFQLHTPQILVVLTEHTPVDLVRMQRWTPGFQSFLRKAYVWPKLVRRTQDFDAIVERAVALGLEDLRKRHPTCSSGIIQRSLEVESVAKEMIRTFKWNNKDSVITIVELARKCVDIAVADGTSKITSRTLWKALHLTGKQTREMALAAIELRSSFDAAPATASG